MKNEIIVKQLLPLTQKQLDAFQHEFGWLLGGTSKIVTHDNYEIRLQIQKRVDASVQGLLVIYLFAMWEEYIERQLEEEWLTNEELTTLKAFRHIRHSIAHGYNGTRARQCRTEFESVMNSSAAFSNIEWDENSIKLEKTNIAYDCYQFMNNLPPQLIARIASDIKPN